MSVILEVIAARLVARARLELITALRLYSSGWLTQWPVRARSSAHITSQCVAAASTRVGTVALNRSPCAVHRANKARTRTCLRTGSPVLSLVAHCPKAPCLRKEDGGKNAK